MEVTVVHLMPWLMERQLDRNAAGMLQKSLEQKGLCFLMETQTAEIAGRDGRVSAVRFKDGSEIPADLVVMAVGIRPNVDLAQSSGLHCNRGIVVSDTMQTHDPRIYAVGECVAHRGIDVRAGGAAVRDGQGLRHHLAAIRHRALSGLGHLDQAQGHRHRSVLRRRFQSAAPIPRRSCCTTQSAAFTRSS